MKTIKQILTGPVAFPAIWTASTVFSVTCLVGCASWFKPSASKPEVPKVMLSSCWDGPNANKRMMNTLSPGMNETKFNEYLNWQKSRTLDGYGRANVAHVFLSNYGDGENARFSIYGNDWDWVVDQAFVDVMKARIKAYRDNGFQVVGWLLADDSSTYANAAKQNFGQMMNDLKAVGLLDDLCMVVYGLEWNEYYGASDMAKETVAVAEVWKGPTGSHLTSGQVSPFGDYVFYQVNPGKSAAWLANETRRIKAAIGNRKLVMFEIERNPSPAKCKAIMDTGAAVGVGNI
jgi:hypothetical protein